MKNSQRTSDEITGSGVEKTEARAMSAFHSIATTLPFDVSVVVGKPLKMTITGDDNILPLIKTCVESGTLSLGVEERLHDAHAKVIIETPSLDAVSLDGSGNLDLNDIESDAFTADLSGSGNLTANGKVKSLHCSSSGSGNMNLESLRASETTARLTGSGNIDSFASEKLTTDLTGSGNIRCAGRPKTTKKQNTGSGALEIMQD